MELKSLGFQWNDICIDNQSCAQSFRSKLNFSGTPTQSNKHLQVHRQGKEREGGGGFLQTHRWHRLSLHIPISFTVAKVWASARMRRYEPSGVSTQRWGSFQKLRYPSCWRWHLRRGKVCRWFVMPGRRLPTTAALGRNRDSCRLWHEEQELRTGSVKRERRGQALSAPWREGGGAQHTEPLSSCLQFPNALVLFLPPPTGAPIRCLHRGRDVEEPF